MTKIITCGELRYRRLEELEALFRTLEIELGRAAPGSPERRTALASLDNVSRAMAGTPQPAAEAGFDALGGLGTLCRPRDVWPQGRRRRFISEPDHPKRLHHSSAAAAAAPISIRRMQLAARSESASASRVIRG